MSEPAAETARSHCTLMVGARLTLAHRRFRVRRYFDFSVDR